MNPKASPYLRTSLISPARDVHAVVLGKENRVLKLVDRCRSVEISSANRERSQVVTYPRHLPSPTDLSTLTVSEIECYENIRYTDADLHVNQRERRSHSHLITLAITSVLSGWRSAVSSSDQQGQLQMYIRKIIVNRHDALSQSHDDDVWASVSLPSQHGIF